MKIKFSIFFQKTGITNNTITKLVSSQNEGIIDLRLKDIASAIKVQQADYPTVLKNLKVILSENNTKLDVLEDGENVNYVVEKIMCFELVNEDYSFDKLVFPF